MPYLSFQLMIDRISRYILGRQGGLLLDCVEHSVNGAYWFMDGGWLACWRPQRGAEWLRVSELVWLTVNYLRTIELLLLFRTSPDWFLAAVTYRVRELTRGTGLRRDCYAQPHG